ncbi:ArsR/SmtB family transcription factor [Micromonospora endolithica]|uniref:ArsR family transcriptional regulator n=1 Tax=Micromonospora endolithica TaxID=230091 RepID=A0A3A9YX99_9ACTN|nr:winged helix-turn-helix domain-containing protein [Micromonospora endolithica]RKN40658.1 ArsR family transcriptional regulator [Micromonospora endolithica]TWJ21748.1 transcriptional regulator, ArsR family [Micromonospora endolithica]
MTSPAGGGPALARLAGLLADDTRARICLTLLDGRAWTVGELARLAGVAPSTASEHVSRLVRGGLLTEQRQGRHRYLRLAGPSVAQLIEDLAGYAPPPPPPVRSLRAARADAALAYARTCYDHLAGRLGVRVRDAMLARRFLDDAAGPALTPAGPVLTPAGQEWLTALAVPLDAPRGRRPLVRDCLDWTERRPHLAGALAAGLLRRLYDLGWLVPGVGRAVRLTPAGRPALAAALGLDPADLAPPSVSDIGGGRA